MQTEFDPYQALLELQRIQFEQAENMVRVSEYLIEMTTTVETQRKQINAMFDMIQGINNIGQINDKRLSRLETQDSKEHK